MRNTNPLSIAILSVSLAGIAAIQRFEGVKYTAYQDIAGIPTICTGHTGKEVRIGQRATSEQCEKFLKNDLKKSESSIRACVKVPITQEQFDALVSFTFNVGGSAMCRSNLVRKLNAGDCMAAAHEFPKWSLVNGKQVNGLLVRRQQEMKIFIKGCKNNGR